MMIFQDASLRVKRTVKALMLLLLLGLVISSFAFAFSKIKYRDKSDASRQLAVSGEGKISIKPDIATFRATIITSGKRIGDAQRENDKASQDVVAFSKRSGIEEKDIKTSNYSIYPQYQYYSTPPCYAEPCPPHRPPVVTGYEVRHTYEVKVRDFAKLDDFLDGVTETGVDEVSSLYFTIDDPKAAEGEARKKAIDDAKKKADELAGELGVRLGKIVSFNESGGGVPSIYYGRAVFAEASGKGGGGPDVQPGEQDVRMNVTITYELR